jgi:hypothetical protein
MAHQCKGGTRSGGVRRGDEERRNSEAEERPLAAGRHWSSTITQLQLRVRSVDWSVSAFMELTLGSSFRPGVARLAARIAPEECIFFARFGLRKR